MNNGGRERKDNLGHNSRGYFIPKKGSLFCRLFLGYYREWGFSPQNSGFRKKLSVHSNFVVKIIGPPAFIRQMIRLTYLKWIRILRLE